MTSSLFHSPRDSVQQEIREVVTAKETAEAVVLQTIGVLKQAARHAYAP